MKTIVVGGNFGAFSKESSIINKLSEFIGGDLVNGGTYMDLEDVAKRIPEYDLVIWMPNINNSYDDISFHKKVGAVVVVSKAIRDDSRTRGDAVSRIFKYHGNAVIAIKYDERFEFTLIDALNNDWAKSENIEDISIGIKKLYSWTKGAKREGTMRKIDNLDKLITINKSVSSKVMKIQGRFFGNLSTRCAALFPSKRESSGYFVSGRNTDKEQLKRSDMVECVLSNDKIMYFGERKPSVDTPVQVALYEIFPKINYMIHGHNFVKGVPSTENYFPCGDKREIPEIVKLIGDSTYGVINLKNHGFLVYAQYLGELEELCNNLDLDEISS